MVSRVFSQVLSIFMGDYYYYSRLALFCGGHPKPQKRTPLNYINVVAIEKLDLQNFVAL
jgi:hypothetical protein